MDYFELLDKNDMKGLDDYLRTHDANEELSNQTLLYWAVHENNLSFVKRLVEKGAEINKRDHLNRTVISIACYFGFYGIVQFLLEKKADTEGCLERAKNGWNGEEQTKIIRLLEEKIEHR